MGWLLNADFVQDCLSTIRKSLDKDKATAEALLAEKMSQRPSLKAKVDALKRVLMSFEMVWTENDGIIHNTE